MSSGLFSFVAQGSQNVSMAEMAADVSIKQGKAEKVDEVAMTKADAKEAGGNEQRRVDPKESNMAFILVIGLALIAFVALS